MEKDAIDSEVKITQASIENIDNDTVKLEYTKETIKLFSLILLGIFNEKNYEKILIVSK